MKFMPMFTNIISLGLWIIPFFIWRGFDTRQPKLFMALVFSLILGLYAFHKGIFKSCKNIWFLLFLAFIPLNFILAPRLGVKIAGVAAPSWVLEAFLYMLVFFLAHASLSSYQFTGEDKNKILKVILWVGSIMALYGLIQWFGFGQFFKKTQGVSVACGTLGTPILLSPFLAMIIPVALYLRKYIPAILMLIVVFLTNSQVAYGALIVSLMFLLGTKSKRLMIAMSSLFIILFLILSIGYFNSHKIKSFVGDNGRFSVWTQIIKDVRNPIPGTTKQYSLTGFGLGSFKYLFHTQHPKAGLGENWNEAHNDYLELFYNTGIMGLGLFLAGLFYMVKQFFPLDRLNAHLLSSFICIAICAGGVFCWQQGAHIYYSITILALLNKENNELLPAA